MNFIIKTIMKAVQIIEQANNGDLSILDALISLNEIKKANEAENDLIKDFEKQNLEQIELSAKEYGNRYCGFEIKVVSGRKMFNFNHIKEYQMVKSSLKEIEEKYKLVFESAQKNISGVTNDGEILDLPIVSYSDSYVVLKKIK